MADKAKYAATYFTTEELGMMIQRLIIILVFMAFVFVAAGFTVLAAWDVPVTQTLVEKPLDNSQFLARNL